MELSEARLRLHSNTISIVDKTRKNHAGRASMFRIPNHWRLPCGRFTAFAVLGIGLMMALAGVGLAACGYSGSQSSTSSTQSQPQAQVTHPPVPAQKCGVVQGLAQLEVPPSDTGAAQAENCFWQAFQRCHPATLVFISSSADTALIRTFTIHDENGTCSN